MGNGLLWLLPSDRHLDDDNHNYTMFLSGGGGAHWASVDSFVKKPPLKINFVHSVQ